ncbi:MAG: glycosyltransferase [Actinobacteria bacterium]|nr:glycosyltransferase [Actinomycetota bacterium]
MTGGASSPRDELERLAGLVDRHRRVVDRGLTLPAAWRGPVRRELAGGPAPEERRLVAAAFDRAVPRAAAGRVPDLRWLLEMHAGIVPGGGAFRTRPARASSSGEPDPGAPPEEIRELVDGALNRARDPGDPSAALRLQLELTLLRPFDRGSGRTARLAASCVLAGAGFRSTLFTGVEQHSSFAPQVYVRALRDVAGSGEVDAWLLYALRAMADRSALATWYLERGGLPRRRLARWERDHPREAAALAAQLDRIRAEEEDDRARRRVGRPPGAGGPRRGPVPRGPVEGHSPTVDDPVLAPAASVIVPAFDDADTIAACLRGLRAQDLDEPFEVVVVSSGPDATPHIVRRGFPEVRAFHSEERLGPGAARNAGVARSRGEVVAFLAADCVPEPAWLRRRVEAHRAGHALVGGFVDRGEDDTLAGRAQWLAKFWAMLPHEGRPPRVGRGPLFHLSYRRDVLDRHGPFPEEHLVGEDTLYNLALVEAGERVLYDPAIRVRHLSDRTTAAVLGGQREQGAAAGALCRREPDVAAFFRPWVRGSPLLAPRIAVRALAAVARYRPGELLRSLVAFPLLVRAVAARRRAFRRAYLGPGEPPPSHAGGGSVRAVRPAAAGSRPLVTAVVAAFDEEDLIARCLDSLLAQRVDRLEVVVVDDGSRDRTAEIAESRGVRVIRLEHGGPARARNAGAAAASGEVLAFVDADLELDADCLRRLARPILGGRALGTFTKEMWVANPELPWAACWTLNRGFPEGHVFPPGFPDRWSNFRAVGREAFMAVGGYEDVGYGEDMTLAPKLGVPAVAVPGAVMWHHNPSTLGEVWENAVWIGRGVRIRELDRVWTRYAPWRSVARGVSVARRERKPRFVPFKVVFDAGILVGYAASHLRPARHWK